MDGIRMNDISMKKLLIPVKTIHSFSVITIIKRLFKEIVKQMTCHKEQYVDDGEMHHPTDDIVWKKFDKMNFSFVIESHNSRLGLTYDGFNLFGNMGSTYNIWPIIFCWLYLATVDMYVVAKHILINTYIRTCCSHNCLYEYIFTNFGRRIESFMIWSMYFLFLSKIIFIITCWFTLDNPWLPCLCIFIRLEYKYKDTYSCRLKHKKKYVAWVIDASFLLLIYIITIDIYLMA